MYTIKDNTQVLSCTALKECNKNNNSNYMKIGFICLWSKQNKCHGMNTK